MRFEEEFFRILSLAVALLLTGHAATAQTAPNAWHGEPCGVVLTYDDAIDADLDNAIPALDSLNLRDTFYLIGSSLAVARRLPKWRRAAQRGHDLGNHALFHPCGGSLTGRGFVTPDNDLSKYTVSRAVAEIQANNTLLQAIDGKTARTFAYPCGDRQIGSANFYNQPKGDVVAARGVMSGSQTPATGKAR